MSDVEKWVLDAFDMFPFYRAISLKYINKIMNIQNYTDSQKTLSDREKSFDV